MGPHGGPRLKFSLRRLLAPAPFTALAFLCACGGGGSSAPQGLPPQPQSPSSSPTPTPTPFPYPTAGGATAAYTGTVTQSFTRYATPSPTPDSGVTPAPSATPWTGSDQASVAQSVSTKANATYNGATGLNEIDTHESDTWQRSSTTLDSQDYVTYATDASAGNRQNVAQVATVATDSGGTKTTTTYGSGGRIVDQLPEITGAQWTNQLPYTTVENDPSGETITNVYASDGSYNGTAQFPEGGRTNVIENGDGSGLYTAPMLASPGDSELTVSTVQNNAITLTFKGVAGMPAILIGQIPVWYPSVPPVLAADSFADAGMVAIPASCKMSTSIATQATRIDEKRVRLDTVMGELETFTASSYVVAGKGVVCATAHDDLLDYYDFSGQTGFLVSMDSNPSQETVTDETLAMQSNGAAASSASRRTQSTRQTQSAAQAFAAFSPSFNTIRAAVAKQRLARARQLFSAVGKIK